MHLALFPFDAWRNGRIAPIADRGPTGKKDPLLALAAISARRRRHCRVCGSRLSPSVNALYPAVWCPVDLTDQPKNPAQGTPQDIGVELLKWMAKVDLCIRDFDLAAPQAATCIQSV